MLAKPDPKDFFVTVGSDSKNYMSAAILNALLASDFYNQAVKPDNRIAGFKRPVLPAFDQRQQLVGAGGNSAT